MRKIRKYCTITLLVFLASESTVSAHDLGYFVTTMRRGFDKPTMQSVARQAYRCLNLCEIPATRGALQEIMARANCLETEPKGMSAAWVYFLIQTNVAHMTTQSTYDLYIAAMTDNTTASSKIQLLRAELWGAVGWPVRSILSDNLLEEEPMLEEVLNHPDTRAKMHLDMRLDRVVISYDLDRYRHRVVWPYRYFIQMDFSEADGRDKYRSWMAVSSDLDKPEFDESLPASFREGDAALSERFRWLGSQGR